jgi:hypothetical protein
MLPVDEDQLTASGFPSASSSAPNAGQVTAGDTFGPLAQAGAVLVAAIVGAGLLV